MKTRVVWAVADLTDLDTNNSNKPVFPRALEKSLIYGPGKPFKAANAKDTSSTKMGFCNLR